MWLMANFSFTGSWRDSRILFALLLWSFCFITRHDYCNNVAFTREIILPSYIVDYHIVHNNRSQTTRKSKARHHEPNPAFQQHATHPPPPSLPLSEICYLEIPLLKFLSCLHICGISLPPEIPRVRDPRSRKSPEISLRPSSDQEEPTPVHPSSYSYQERHKEKRRGMGSHLTHPPSRCGRRDRRAPPSAELHPTPRPSAPPSAGNPRGAQREERGGGAVAQPAVSMTDARLRLASASEVSNLGEGEAEPRRRLRGDGMDASACFAIACLTCWWDGTGSGRGRVCHGSTAGDGHRKERMHRGRPYHWFACRLGNIWMPTGGIPVEAVGLHRFTGRSGIFTVATGSIYILEMYISISTFF
jgi:hypothetical protein